MCAIGAISDQRYAKVRKKIDWGSSGLVWTSSNSSVIQHDMKLRTIYVASHEVSSVHHRNLKFRIMVYLLQLLIGNMSLKMPLRVAVRVQCSWKLQPWHETSDCRQPGTLLCWIGEVALIVSPGQGTTSHFIGMHVNQFQICSWGGKSRASKIHPQGCISCTEGPNSVLTKLPSTCEWNRCYQWLGISQSQQRGG